MENRSNLKQRLARLFRPSTLLQTSCNSTSSGSVFTSSAANTSSRRSLSTAASNDSLFLRNFSSSSRTVALDCIGGGCRPTKSSEPDAVSVVKKKERRVRESGEFYETGEREGMACPPASPSSPLKQKKNIAKTRKKLFLSNAYGFTSSSEFFFSSDDEDETETFFSSRSFSSDYSSDFYKRPASRKKKKHSKYSSRRPPTRRGRRTKYADVQPEEEEEEEEGGVPVMKRSSDPYVDFRNSMVEMIVDRQIFGAKDLERLLHCYMSLNVPSHHSVILRAFADISEVLFGH